MRTLGYIEVEGLSNAIIAADKMLKTADVELKSVENTRGGGWVTVTITGDVAAVGVSIATAKGMMKDHYVSSTVLANPAKGLESLGKTDLLMQRRVTYTPEKPGTEKSIEESIEKDETTSELKKAPKNKKSKKQTKK